MKIRYIIILFTICLAACKQYLEVAPVSSFDPAITFSNVVNARMAVLGAYGALTGDQAYGIRVNMYYAYDSDEMMGQGGTPYPDNERRDIAHYNVTPNNSQLAQPFSQLYNGIERANLCIYYIPKMAQYTTGTEVEKKELQRLHGEALTLRAQFYYELIRNWGDVPAHFQPAIFETDQYPIKKDRDTIYDHILSDLAVAAPLVPWRTAAGPRDERITQGAVRALRAKIALARGGYSLRLSKQMERPANYKTFYEIARTECNEIMQHRGDHSLNTSYLALFKDNLCAHRLDPTGEIIWEVAMAGSNSATGDSKMGYYNGPRYGSTGNGALTILPSYFYTFDSVDARRDVTCAPYDLTTTLNKTGRPLQTMVDGKFRRDWISNPVVVTSAAQYFGLNWPLIRFSDVLLMYAEADNELNNGASATAVAAFEEVRKRAYGANPIGVTPVAYADFFDAIVKERLLEFGGEGIRKYDLIRWNLLAAKIAATKTTLAAMSARTAPYNTLPQTMYFRNNSQDLVWAGSFYKPTLTPAPAGHTAVAWFGTAINTTIIRYYAIEFKTGKSELLPIAQSVLDANPNLKQDYGY